MSRRKTTKVKLNENRCQEPGPDYQPFIKANEGSSNATCWMIPDRYEGRMIHCLSETEARMYYLLRWNPNVVHIREQYLLDNDRVNDVRIRAGYGTVTKMAAFTTDFLVDFNDWHQEAYSVKYSKKDFDPNNRKYKGKPNSYAKLIERQNTERLYWETQGVKFNIVTREDMEKYRVYIRNIEAVMGYQDELLITNTEEKLMYLIAHHVIEVDMETDLLNPVRLAKSMSFDIDAAYDMFVSLKEAYING